MIPENILNKTESLKNTGLALDIKLSKKSHFNYIFAYEGDYLILNDILKEENKIKDKNYYIGVEYSF